ncbi:MAG: NADP oxidoreductase, partial [Anaerolineales bacterium]
PNGVTLTPPHPGVDEAEAMVRGKQPRYVTYADWKRLDQMEIERGEAQGRPRLKFTRIEEMLEALGK